MSIIQLKGVTKKYGNKTILNDLSLKFEAGELIAVMGASGCGKSTLLNIIGLLESFDEGELVIDNKRNIKPDSRAANRILREKISYLFQNFALIDEETVSYNLDLALKYVPCSRKEKKAKKTEVLKFVGLDGFEKRKIFELSGGEQQRVAIARILLKPSDIVLADEPTGSLDEINRDIVLNLLKSINDQGKTVIIVTHDKYIGSRCRRVINL